MQMVLVFSFHCFSMGGLNPVGSLLHQLKWQLHSAGHFNETYCTIVSELYNRPRLMSRLIAEI